MDKIGRTILEIACLLVLAVFLFPPFQLGNGQPEWGFIGRPPAVNHWVTLDEVLANNFKTAQIHWSFLIMEVTAIAVMAVSVWVSIHDDSHRRGH
jgi:hypothetical protein